MPEFPDIVVYIEALEKRILGATLHRAEVSGPSLLRTAVPPLDSLQGKKVQGIRRLGKRICIGLEPDLWLVLHLMIAGRLHWRDKKPSSVGRRNLATFEFSSGVLTLTEAGTKRRASLHVVQGGMGCDPLIPAAPMFSPSR